MMRAIASTSDVTGVVEHWTIVSTHFEKGEARAALLKAADEHDDVRLMRDGSGTWAIVSVERVSVRRSELREKVSGLLRYLRRGPLNPTMLARTIEVEEALQLDKLVTRWGDTPGDGIAQARDI